MSFNLHPVDDTKSVPQEIVGPPVETEKSKKTIDATVDHTAREKLSTPQETTPAASTSWGLGGLWSWFVGKKEETPVQEQETEEKEGGPSDEGLTDGGLGDGLAEDAHKEIIVAEDKETVTQDTEAERAAKDEEIARGDAIAQPPVQKGAVKKEKLEKTVVKTYQAAQKSTFGKVWGGFTGAVGNTLLWAGTKTGAIQTFVGKTYGISEDHKNAVVDSQKKEMLTQLNDPQYVQFYETVSTALIPTIKQKVLDNVTQEEDSVAEIVASQEELILKLLEVILARGFANLARNVAENGKDIPNFGKQPSLVSVISLLCQTAGGHIDQEKLKQLEQNYRKDQKEVPKFIEKLFPGIEDQPKSQESLQLYIKEYTHWKTDANRKTTIKTDLFPDLATTGGQKGKEIQDFFTTLDSLQLKNREMHQLFTHVSEDILLCLFPQKFQGIEEISGWSLTVVEKTAFNFDSLRDIVAELLQESYAPMENDLARNEALEKDLTACLGAPDLKPVVQAPSALLVAFAKNYIQSDPSVVQTTSGLIDDVLWQGEIFGATNAVKKQLGIIREKLEKELNVPQGFSPYQSLFDAQLRDDLALIQAFHDELTKIEQGNPDLKGIREQKKELQNIRTASVRSQLGKLNEEIDQVISLQKNRLTQRKHLLDQLSQQQLASWIVESVQSMLNTEDAHLLGVGQFVQQSLNNLTLALLTKGAKLVIPDGEKIEPNAFIKEFSERLIEKAEALQGEEAVSETFWADFVNDLPLPPLVKTLMVPLIVEKAKSLQDTFTQTAPDIQEIQKVYGEALQAVESYEGGEQLLAITETVSDQIIGQVLEQNVELVSTLGLGDTLEELFDQYLPGITFNEDLKNWFKENVSALGVTEEGKSPQSIVLLKQGIQAVMLKAMVNTIKKNFQNSSKDYAAQLLKNFQTAFSSAFTGFSAVQRKQLDKALSIQIDIDNKSEQLKANEELVAKKPVGIDADQSTLLNKVILANARLIRASNYVDNLKEKREEILTTLNRRQKKKLWTAADLPTINEALALRKDELALSKPDDYAGKLKVKISQLGKLKNTGSISTAESQELEQRQLLLILLEMSPDALKQLSEASHIHATLRHAESELDLLKTELKAKTDAIAHYDTRQIKNPAEWAASKDWLNKVLTSKKESNQIYREIANLEKELDNQLSQIGSFQVLSKELTGLLGLDKKEKLDLPPFLQDKVWPLIESAQDKQIARFLFTQITPLLISVTDIQENKTKLQQLSNGNPFLGQLIQAASEDMISRIPDFVTSYKPFAKEILAAAGNSQPTSEEIEDMEDSLSYTLIQMGKSGTTASMLRPLVKGLVPAAREDAFSQAIATFIDDWDDMDQPQDEIFELLKKEVATSTPREEQKLEKQAELLTKSIIQFLFNRGKGDLDLRHLIDAYNNQVRDDKALLLPDQYKTFENNIQQKKVIEKIKGVVITPEEIAVALNDAIPGATDLHTLIAPQLQAVISGQDQTFKDNREVLQQFLEGTILRLFVKIAEANQSPAEDPLTALTGKLKDLAANAIPKQGQTTEEAARMMIDQVLTDVLDINSKQDFDNIPAALQQLAYDKVKEQAYQQLTPLILPIIERNQNRAILKDKSGSDFLGSLCEALSKDVFAFVPSLVKSYHTVSKELWVVLSEGKTPSADRLEKFAVEIATLVKDKNVSEKALVQAYSKVEGKILSDNQQIDLIAKLKKQKAKETIKGIVITPEEIAATVGELVPHLDTKLQKSLAEEMDKLIKGGDAYLNVSSFAGAFVEGMLLRVFIGIAEKNPKQMSKDPTIPSKDSMVVVTEKLLDLAVKQYQQLKTGADVKAVAQELNDSIMKDVLGIDSPAAFKGLPEGLQIKAYDAIKDQLAGMLINIQQSLATLDDADKQVQKTKEDVKKFGIADSATKGFVQILAEDLANMVVASVPHVLTEKASSDAEDIKGIVSISKGLEGYLEDVARGNVQIAKVLLSYTQGDQFKQILGDNLGVIAQKDQLGDEKKMAADLLGNLLLQPIGTAIEKAINFEEQHKKQFNQKLMAKVLHVGANHLKHLNDAKALAAKEGRKDITHEDFLSVVGSELHPGVTTAPISYQESIDAITEKIYGALSSDQEKAWLAERGNVRQLIAKLVRKEAKGSKVMSLDEFVKEFEFIHLKIVGKPLTLSQQAVLKTPNSEGFTLRDIIRKEAEAPSLQKKEAAYDPASDAILKMLFPTGQRELTFVPENLRGTVWNMFKDQLFPIVLPMITETILEPSTINKMVLSSLEAMRDNLSGEIVVSNEPPEPADLPLDELDEASGELVAEVLKATTLPEWAKKFLIDPQTGEISESMKKTIGASLRQQFNDSFIKDKLKIALESAVQRDENGTPVLNFDARSSEVKKAEAAKKAEQMEKDLKSATKEAVNVSISYAIRSMWVNAQASFDKAIGNVLGKPGLAIKQALDLVFRVVFFKIIGTLLYYPVILPIKLGVQNFVYWYLSVDENRKNLLEMFTKVPMDQPEADLKDYAVLHEDLIFKVGQALGEVVEEFLDTEPVIPKEMIQGLPGNAAAAA